MSRYMALLMAVHQVLATARPRLLQSEIDVLEQALAIREDIGERAIRGCDELMAMRNER